MKNFLVLLAFAGFAMAAPKVEMGAINGAAYRIDIPDNWNGGLVVYCHGYNATPVKFGDKLSPVLQPFVDQGYALAQSGYAAGGWAVQEAAVDTESLRRYFVEKYGKPKETFITGHSMGGFLTMMLMERYPDHLRRGPPAVRAAGADRSVHGSRGVRQLCAVQLLFPGRAAGAEQDPQGFRQQTGSCAKKVEQALDSAPEKAASLRHFRDSNLKSNKDLAGTTAFIAYMIKELNERAGGNPFDNRNVIYNGTLDDVEDQRRDRALRGRSEGAGVSAQLLHAERAHSAARCSPSIPVTIRWCRCGFRTTTSRRCRTPAPRICSCSSM